MNTEQRKNAQNDFVKGFFKLFNNAVFGKPMENVRKRSDNKQASNNKRKKELVSEPNYHTTIFFP